MKRNRLLALALAVCLCATLVAPASAAGTTTFTDVAGHWALPYIQDMTAAGVLTGYGDGTFKPENSVLTVEALALCARVTQKLDTRFQIAADRAVLLKETFPDMPDDWWFHKEAATCMALGVVDAATLSDLHTSGDLNRPMTKADFAMYLVRGMGLEDLARTLDADALSFADEYAIADKYRPYVKLLYSYGVLTGDEANRFNPDQPMSRAICATMLSRAMEHIVEERGVNVELPQYTKYAWTSGLVVDVDTAQEGGRTLTLKSELSPAETVYLPFNTKVYQYNKLDNFTALKNSAFVKVCYASDNKTVETVRVTPAALVERLEGNCGRITPDSVVIDGSLCTIDRFTQVSAGGKTGDRSIIDYLANYTDAEAGVNSAGTVLWLKLSGGTRLVEGILTDVTVETVGLSQRTTITVTGYNGASTTYVVAESVPVTINGDEAVLRENQEGRQIILRVSDADLNEVKAVEVNMTDRYLQGILRAVNTKNTPTRLEIKVQGDSRATAYDVAEDCEVTYRGMETDLTKLALNSFVTAKVEGGTITTLYAWQGYEDTEGTLTGLTYGDPVVLEVTLEDNTVVRFSIPVERLKSVAFTSAGKDCDITQLHTGDHVVVTVLYNDVTQVDCTPQSANVTGTLSAVAFNEDNSIQLTVTFSDGTRHTYSATAATTVTQSGKPVAISDLASRRQSKISLVAEGDRALSIEITGSTTAKDSISGIILTKDDQTRVATILVEENGQTRPVNVHIPSGVTILDVTTSTTLTNISRLNEGETIQAWGNYAANGNFEATSVVRK